MQNAGQFETNGQSDKATKQNISKINDVEKRFPPCKGMKIAKFWLQTGSTKALAEARSTWGKGFRGRSSTWKASSSSSSFYYYYYRTGVQESHRSDNIKFANPFHHAYTKWTRLILGKRSTSCSAVGQKHKGDPCQA